MSKLLTCLLLTQKPEIVKFFSQFRFSIYNVNDGDSGIAGALKSKYIDLVIVDSVEDSKLYTDWVRSIRLDVPIIVICEELKDLPHENFWHISKLTPSIVLEFIKNIENVNKLYVEKQKLDEELKTFKREINSYLEDIINSKDCITYDKIMNVKYKAWDAINRFTNYRIN